MGRLLLVIAVLLGIATTVVRAELIQMPITGGVAPTVCGVLITSAPTDNPVIGSASTSNSFIIGGC